jgi:hypothetical protein
LSRTEIESAPLFVVTRSSDPFASRSAAIHVLGPLSSEVDRGREGAVAVVREDADVVARLVGDGEVDVCLASRVEVARDQLRPDRGRRSRSRCRRRRQPGEV